MAVALVQDDAVFHDGLTGTIISFPGATTSGNTLVYIIQFNSGDSGDVANTTPTGWTLVAAYDDPLSDSRYYFYIKLSDGTETSLSDVDNSGYGGGAYVAEVSGLTGTEQSGGAATGYTWPSDFVTPAHTAYADEVCFHVFTDLAGAGAPSTVSWDVSGLAADGGSSLAAQEHSFQGGTDYFISVKPVTYSSSGSKSGLPGAADGYGSFSSPAVFYTTGFSSVSDPVPAAGDFELPVRTRRVLVKELPFNISTAMVKEPPK
jgi:hypothetical protein